MALTTITSGSDATVAVTAQQYILLSNASTATARLEYTSGTDIGKIIEWSHNGRQVYGPLTAGDVKVSAISGNVDYEVSSTPDIDVTGWYTTSDAVASDGSTTEESVATTTYTVSSTDFDGKTKVFTNASGCLVTIPISAATTAGQVFQWRQAAGAGQITFQGDGTSTVDAADDSLTSGGELSVGAVVHMGGDDFLLVGQIGIPRIIQNSQSAAYELVLSDAGKHILHPSADTTARTFTIPANSAVAFPVGTVVTFINQDSAGTVTIAITTDTMRLAGAGTTGSRTLAANGIATAVKLTSTEWIISGTGLT